MDSDKIWHHIDTERTALADILATLPEKAWRTPSLCAAWTVRDVAAHLAMAQTTIGQFFTPTLLGAMARSGFRYHPFIGDAAIRLPLDHGQIIATIRGFVGSRQKAPFVTEKEPLLDILIHTQDICVPLGISHEMPADAAVVSLERVIEWSRRPMRLGPRMRDVHLVATDVDWQYGSGHRVEGPIQWLLLAAAGRTLAHDHLSGQVDALTGQR